jgi:5'-nucleotidase
MPFKAAALYAVVLAAALVTPTNLAASSESNGVTLTILHNNDASSMLLGTGNELGDFGGVARFKTLVDAERAKASTGPNDIAIVLSAGNSIEAGANLEGSLARGAPYFDAVAMRSIGYDAAVLGQQDFGLGPDVLAGLLCGILRPGGGKTYPGCNVTGRSAFPFLAANLDFAREPELQEFAGAGDIAPSTIVTKDDHRIGVVGVTSPALPYVSSPRNVTVMSNLSRIVQGEVDRLQTMGVNKIVVLAQLDSIKEEVALAGALTGVDVIVAGGTGEVMARPSDLLVPGDRYDPALRYPLYATDSAGQQVPIVTVGGGYKYLGKLVLEFDDVGEVVRVDSGSGAIRVAGAGEAGGVEADHILVNAIEKPLQAYLDGLAGSIVATSEVSLDGRREVIRTRESNLGDLMADAALRQARELAVEFAVDTPGVAILNAGGMRLDQLRDAGPLSLLDTYEIAPFASFITVVESVSPAEFKLIVENALSKLPLEDGRFGQIAGFTVTYDPAGKPLAFDAGGNPVNAGARVLSLRLNNGTYIVEDGAVVLGAPDVAIATIDFMARGGDQYAFPPRSTTLGVSYQQALVSYIANALGGVISSAGYPEGGEGRIVAQ